MRSLVHDLSREIDKEFGKVPIPKRKTTVKGKTKMRYSLRFIDDKDNKPGGDFDTIEEAIEAADAKLKSSRFKKSIQIFNDQGVYIMGHTNAKDADWIDNRPALTEKGVEF